MSENGPFLEVVPGRWKLRKEITVGELITFGLVAVALLFAWFDYGYRIKALEASAIEQQKNHAAIILFVQQQEEFPVHRHIDGGAQGAPGRILYPRGRRPDGNGKQP